MQLFQWLAQASWMTRIVVYQWDLLIQRIFPFSSNRRKAEKKVVAVKYLDRFGSINNY